MRKEEGFTLIEILVTMSILTVGVAAVFHTYIQVSQATRLSRQMDFAHTLASNIVEETHGLPIEDIEAVVGDLESATDSLGILYTRSLNTSTAFPGTDQLVLISVTVSFHFDNSKDDMDRQSTTMQIIRNRTERF